MEKKELTPLEKELKELIEKYKPAKVYTLTVPLEDDEDSKVATFYLKWCDRKTEEMMEKHARTSRERAVIMGITALRLGGDDVSILSNNEFASRAAEFGLAQHMKPAKAELKKN